jgi:hypothetical protein
MKIHQLTTNEACAACKSSPAGLSADQAARRLVEFVVRPFTAFAQSPNIFATIKIRTAPPRPPPPSRYTSEYPIAANGNMVSAKSSTIYSLMIRGEIYYD